MVVSSVNAVSSIIVLGGSGSLMSSQAHSNTTSSWGSARRPAVWESRSLVATVESMSR